MLTLIFRNAYFQLSLIVEQCDYVYIQLKCMRIMYMIIRCLWMRIIELGSCIASTGEGMNARTLNVLLST